MTELDKLVMAKIMGEPIKLSTKSTEKRLIDEFKRAGLGEGRSYGLGLSFVHKESEDVYRSLMAYTACKDYLNDFVYVETTGNPLRRIHGFEHKYTGLLKGDYFYPSFRAVHHLGGSSYSLFDKIKESLKQNNNNLITFLNKLEKELKIENLSEFECYTSDTLILKTPNFWIKYPFLFSMYGLLIRCFMDVTESDLKDDITKVIKEKKNCIIPEDGSLLRSLQIYIPFDLDKLLDYKYPSSISSSYIHNFGIVSRLNEMKKSMSC